MPIFIVVWRQVMKRQQSQHTQQQSHAAHSKEIVHVHDYPDLQIPRHPHMEFCVQSLNPPTAMRCSNSLEPFAFENEYCRGSYIVFHPPAEKGAADHYAEYFRGKKRLWELRLQLQFKRPPSADDKMYFAVELEEYVPMSRAVQKLQSALIALVQKTVADGFSSSSGDDPSKSTGEIERPYAAFPLWGFDQFIVTPEGEEPPRLTDPNFPELGQKRVNRVREYAKALAEVEQKFDSVSTYTFSTYGVSRFLDVLKWRVLGIPVLTPISFNKFAGRPPVHAVIYTLMPASQCDDKRHLQSRKQYYFDATIWSSSFRPEKRRFEQLAGFSSEEAPKAKTSNRFGAALSCCMARPR
jgi:hypothetical protein